jgi:hypothetical protein
MSGTTVRAAFVAVIRKSWTPTNEAKQKVGVHVLFNSLSLYGSPKTKIGLYISPASASIHIQDQQGYQTTIGEQSLVAPGSGERHTTSAASIVMFNNNKEVIWRASGK